MTTDCMIFTAAGDVWLQVIDASGRMQLSSCGRLPLSEARSFCRQHHMDLVLPATPDRKPRTESYGWTSELSPIAREELAARGR